MFHKDSIKNQFGFYECDDFQTYSKLEVIEYANCSNKTPVWNFNQDIYSSWDWLTEPTEDLWELYRQRAQQIRDRYDYVVVMFSGGADSSNVLDVFLRNGIKVDELASYHQLGGSKSSDNYMDSEVFKVAYPRAQKVIEEHPEIKCRMIDWSSLVQELLNDPKEITEFPYKQNKFLTPSNMCRHYLRNYVDDWRNIIASGKKLCLVWGANKPSMKTDSSGKNYYVYHDSNDFLVPVQTQNENNIGYYDELFYNPGDTPIIACKQSHLIKNAAISNPSMLVDDNWYDNNKDKVTYHQWLNMTNGNLTINGTKYRLDRESVHEIVYPYWDTKTYSDGKPSSWIKNPRDNWLFNSGSTQITQLEESIKSAFNRVGTKWWKNPNDYTQGIPSFTNVYNID